MSHAVKPYHVFYAWSESAGKFATEMLFRGDHYTVTDMI